MLELFENLAKSLDEAQNASGIAGTLREFFYENFNTEDCKIFILDEKQNCIKSFENNNPAETFDSSDKISEVFNVISDKKIVIKNNLLYYELPEHGRSIGLLSFKNGDFERLKEFLKTASYIISLKIQNILLAQNMQKNIDFHELMRNIAKIIETQYELSYIIPLIGEMIDKFMTDILVYIFVKNDAKFELMWPSNCNDKRITAFLDNLEDTPKSIILNNGKTGLFPLVSENRILGCIVAKSTGDDITETDVNYLEQLAKQSSATINRANVYAEILKHATLDALTGFYNRRQLEERIKQETAKAKRQKTPLCAIMIDIDFFKRINDIYGHAAGDLVLKTVSKTMRSQLREYDVAGRYGGEEFAVLLPFTKTEEAVMVAERLRQAVENKKIDLSKINHEMPNKIIDVTISLGIYELKVSDSADDLLKEADKALYQAKETGRNRIIIKTDE